LACGFVVIRNPSVPLPEPASASARPLPMIGRHNAIALVLHLAHGDRTAAAMRQLALIPSR
jgi:hypothetical protein